MNRISMNQAAEAVKLDVTALRALLECCGVAVLQEWQREADLRQQEEAAKRYQGKLAWLAERYTMMIDTCSLLHSQFPAFVEHMTPLLRQQGKALIVPSGVVEELKSLLERKPELRETVRPVAVVLPEDCGDPDLRTYDFFRGLCKAMQGEYGKTARGKIKDLRTAFKQGELESRFFLQDKGVRDLLYHGFEAAYRGGARWEQYRRLLTQGGGLDKEPFRTISLGESSARHCLFFDAIEMIDHCDFLEEVEA